MRVTHDTEADAAYVYFTEDQSLTTYVFDDSRNIDFTADGTVIGIEFLNVNQGARPQGLPISGAVAVATALSHAGVPVLDTPTEVSGIEIQTPEGTLNAPTPPGWHIPAALQGTPALPTTGGIAAHNAKDLGPVDEMHSGQIKLSSSWVA